MATYSLKPPEGFSFKPAEWPSWIKEFCRFRNASRLARENGETQRDTLLYIMGRESEKVFGTFHLAPADADGQGGESDRVSSFVQSPKMAHVTGFVVLHSNTLHGLCLNLSLNEKTCM